MKILYHHRIASKDGQYVHVEELTNALKKLGHEIIMVGPKVVEQKEFGSDGGFVARLKKYLPGTLYEILEFGYNAIAFIKLAHAVTKHRPDGLYERYNLFLPAGVWIKKIFKLPMLLEVNAPLYDERLKYNGIHLKKLAKWTENYTWQNADHVLPVTRVLAEIIKEQAGVPEEKIEVIHNGIDPVKFRNAPTAEDAKRRLGLQGKFVLGFTGFIREWNKLDIIIDLISASEFSDKFHLLIIGDGPSRRLLEVKAKELSVAEKISITGVVNRVDICNYIASFDIALIPDVVHYASPLKIFEYMYLGRAIVAPNKNNICEIVVDNHSACLFDANDLNSFKEKIQLLIKNHRLRKKISKNAKCTISEKRFTWHDNAKRVSNLFKN